MKKITILTDDYHNLTNVLYSLSIDYSIEEVEVVSNCCRSKTTINNDNFLICFNCNKETKPIEL